jgi:hypothetical protein
VAFMDLATLAPFQVPVLTIKQPKVNIWQRKACRLFSSSAGI